MLAVAWKATKRSQALLMLQARVRETSDVSTPKNMSKWKLMNSSFKEFEDREGVMTHSQISFLKSNVANTEKAHGFKLQDAELLSECISTSAICSL